MRLLRLIDRFEEIFLAVGLAVMTVLTFTQVLLREFGTGFVWSLEATTYTFAWLVLIGMSYGVRTRAHISVDLLAAKLPPRAARGLTVVVLLLALAYCGFMFVGSLVFVDRLMTLGNNARDIPLPRWLLTGVMPFAFLLLAARLCQAAWPALIRPAERGAHR